MAVRLDHGGDELLETHEINVTPFIDVILVLLIIFMVAAPLATVDVPVDLPTSTATPQPRPDKPLFLSVKADLGLVCTFFREDCHDSISPPARPSAGRVSVRRAAPRNGGGVRSSFRSSRRNRSGFRRRRSRRPRS